MSAIKHPCTNGESSTSLTSLHLLALRRPVLLLRPEAGLPLRPVGWPEAPLPECGRRHRRPANNIQWPKTILSKTILLVLRDMGAC